MTNRKPWTPAENLAVSRLYFDMLAAAMAGREYNKAAMIRSAQGAGDQWQNASHDADGNAVLRNRSRGSIEAKLMNCTAAHRDYQRAHGLPFDDTMHDHGYRALPNYQASLYDALADTMDRVMRSERLA